MKKVLLMIFFAVCFGIILFAQKSADYPRLFAEGVINSSGDNYNPPLD